MNSNSYINHGESRVYHQFRRNCISSKRSFVYHHCEKKCSLRLMIYTFGDDIPLLSQWIKNRQVETCRFLVEATGFEPAASASRTARYSWFLIICTTYSGFCSEKPSSLGLLSPLFPCTPYGSVGWNVVVKTRTIFKDAAHYHANIMWS